MTCDDLDALEVELMTAANATDGADARVIRCAYFATWTNQAILRRQAPERT